MLLWKNQPEVVKKQQLKKTEPADQKDIAKLQSPEKMVLSSQIPAKMLDNGKESTKPDIIAKGSVAKSENSIPAKTQASKVFYRRQLQLVHLLNLASDKKKKKKRIDGFSQ